MAKIKHYSKDGLLTGEYTNIETDGVFAEWLINNYNEGDAFTVFKDSAAVENDITHNEEELLKDGYFIVTDTPSDPITITIATIYIIQVAVIALVPKPDLPQNVNRSQESPNNRLTSRSNQARPLERIPDISGQVLSIPDVIQPTYSIWNANQQIEYGFYCVGRGPYLIEEVTDSGTPIETIEGAGAGIYEPFTNPNNSAASQIIGDVIEREIVTPYRSNQVDGIILSPDFLNGFVDYTDIQRVNDLDATNIVVDRLGDWDRIYTPGDIVTLTNFVVSAVDISGDYTVDKIRGDRLFLIGPHSAFSEDDPTSGDVQLKDAKEFTDWFYMTEALFDKAIINIVAPNGLYKDDGGARLEEATVGFKIELYEVDSNNNFIGILMEIDGLITGNDSRIKGHTEEYDFFTDGGKSGPIKFAARAQRTTPRDTGFNGSVVDNIKFEDLYGIQDILNLDIGNVTTIQTKTTATPFASSFKERRLNCLATKLLNEYQGGGVFASNKTASTSAVQSFITDSIDPVIGNRTLQEIDADAILALENEIDSYFGNSENSRFSYTFDSTDITYQDYAQTVFNAINCIAFREGSLISARFEKPQTIPAMLFTHRSKLPGTETYTRNFNSSNINDGVEFNWVDPETNTTETIYLNNGNPTNPKKFNIAGIRSEAQAIVRASREWNKIRYSKLSCEVEVTAEGRYIQPMDMVSIVKGSRIYTFDGEVLSVDGLELTLSQDVEFIQGDNHSIILKNDDGTTNGINCTQGSETNKVTLNQAPQQTIRTGIESRRTEFSFGNEAKQEAQLWTVQEVDLSDKLSVSLKAINYTDQYYDDDI